MQLNTANLVCAVWFITCQSCHYSLAVYGYLQLCRNLHGLRAEVADKHYQDRTISCRCREKLLPRRLRQAGHGCTKEESEDDQDANGLKR